MEETTRKLTELVYRAPVAVDGASKKVLVLMAFMGIEISFDDEKFWRTKIFLFVVKMFPLFCLNNSGTKIVYNGFKQKFVKYSTIRMKLKMITITTTIMKFDLFVILLR